MKKKRIAIIGHASRLPQSPSGEAFWRHLCAGDDLITQVPQERWAQGVLQHPQRTHPGTSVTFAAGTVGDVAGFDCSFFRISPREAAAMDPQQRLLLEMSWEALQHAGVPPSRLPKKKTGVFIGLSSTDYGYRLADDLAGIAHNTATGVTASIAANRISYFYDLQGPSTVVDTACSSALVAFHQACQSILHGECELALTGAIQLQLHPFGFLIFSKASMISQRGRCRPFDASADGYVRSEGGGIFVLKDYDRARRDGDRILAVVAHTAINTDGHKSGLTIPRTSAQQALLEQSYAAAGIEPAQITYLEAHGTGTAVGDPAEVEAIGLALGRHRSAGRRLPIGSVKSNLGHLETASGIPGLLKGIYTLQHRQIPPTIGIETLHPRLPLKEYHLEVVQELRPLNSADDLVIGVNSFGFGGANAHVILQSPPPTRSRRIPSWKGRNGQPKPLCLTAASSTALEQVVLDFADHLSQVDSAAFYAALYQANFRREYLPHRALFWLSPEDDPVATLRAFATPAGKANIATTQALTDPRGPLFVYSGNGCQWMGMGRALLQEPSFAASIAEIDSTFVPLAGYRLRDEIEGLLGEGRYAATEFAQPALFAIQVASTSFFRAQGIEAQGVLGHSVGEVAAAWSCGALSLADAVRVIYIRSHLQARARSQGQMTAVALAAEELQSLLESRPELRSLEIAAWNSPRGSTVVGDSEILTRLEATLRERGIAHKRLDIDYPFHSSKMDPLREDLLEALHDLQVLPPRIPFYSAVTGQIIEGPLLDASYWWDNIRQPVRFAQAVAVALRQSNLLVEIGGHPVLRGYLQESCAAQEIDGRVITTLRRQEDDPLALCRARDLLWLSGIEPDWKRYFPVVSPPVDLPAYPWERERYWQEATPESARALLGYPVHPLLGHPVANHPGEWEQRLDTALLPFLADHQVGDGVVFPGAGYVELALAAARERFAVPDEPSVWTLEELEILQPLLVEEAHSKMLRTLLSEQGHFRILSRPQLEAEWTMHAKGRVRRDPFDPLRPKHPSSPQALVGGQDFTGEEHYHRCSAVGLHYGPAFQTVQHGTRLEGMIHAHLQCKDTGSTNGYLLHPTLLDGALQLMVDFLGDSPESADSAYVPVRFGGLQVFAEGASSLRVQVELRRHSPQSILAQLHCWDEQGRLVAQCAELRLRRVRLRVPETERLRYYRTELRPLPGNTRAEAWTVLDEGLRRQLQTLYQETPALERYTAEYSPLVLALLQQYQTQEGASTLENEPSARDIWDLLYRDYPEFFPITLALGRYGIHGAGVYRNEELAASLYDCIFPLLNKALSQWIQRYVERWLAQASTAEALHFIEISQHSPEALPLLSASDPVNTRLFLWRGQGTDEYDDSKEQRWRTLSLDGDSVSHPMQLIWLRLDAPTSEQQWHLLQLAEARLGAGGMLLLQGVEPEPWWGELTNTQTTFPKREEILDWCAAQALTVALCLPEEVPAGCYLLILQKTSVPSTKAAAVKEAEPAQATEPLHYLFLTCDTSTQEITPVWDAACQEMGATAHHLELPGDSMTLPSKLQELSVPLEGILLYLPFSQSLADGPSASRALQEHCERLRQIGLWSLQQENPVPILLISPGGLGNPHLDAMMRGIQALGQAGLTGFARTLQNEWSELDLRIFDGDPQNPRTVMAMLAQCRNPGPELEIVFDGEGNRYYQELQGHSHVPTRIQETDESSLNLQLQFSQLGQLSYLHWISVPEPTLRSQQVLVDVEAVGLNFRDVMYALGFLADEALENGFSGPGLGLEFAGRITRMGAAVTRFQVGDRVLGFAPASFRARLLSSETTLVPIPEGLAPEAAATIPTVFLTAWYALHTLAQVQAGEKVLIHGGAGGVGIAAIQIAQYLGAEIFATAGSAPKRDFLRLLGVQHIYDSRSLAFADAILEDTQAQGVDVILNSLYGEAVTRNLQILKPFGRFLELGKRDFYENNPMGLRPFRNNLSYFGIDADQLLQGRPGLAQQLFQEILGHLQQGEFHPLPAKVFPAAQVQEAFRYMQQARQIGKVVVQMSPPYLPKAPRPVQQQTLALSPNGVYLVTGGTAGFGLASAHRLVERGARQLVLVSRTGKPLPEALPLLDQMRALGAQVHTWPCDVRDPEQVQGLVQRIQQELGPLRGILHAAAIIEDALAQNLSEDLLARVLAPKVAGAYPWHDIGAPRDNRPWPSFGGPLRMPAI